MVEKRLVAKYPPRLPVPPPTPVSLSFTLLSLTHLSLVRRPLRRLRRPAVDGRGHVRPQVGKDALERVRPAPRPQGREGAGVDHAGGGDARHVDLGDEGDFRGLCGESMGGGEVR